jgi:branched-chain amino acid transport system permease protein
MIDIEIIIRQTMYGIGIGMIFALVALGLSLTFGKMKIINLAHMLFYALGAYLVFTTTILAGNFWYGVLLSVAICFILGMMSEQMLKYLYGKTIEYTFIVTFAILLIGIDIIKSIWGVDYKAVTSPKELSWTIPFLGIEFYRVFVIIFSAVLYLLIILFMRYSMLGKIIVAFIDNDEHLQAMGINPRIATLLMFALGSALAGIGGSLHAPLYVPFPYMVGDMLLYAFATVVAGGIGSVTGTLVGGIILGLGYSYAGYIQPFLSPIVVFLILFIILIVKPEGMFGTK